MFEIIKTDKNSKARLGVLSTPHGKIETPSYVIVATHAQVKCLKPSDIKKTKTQIVIANTYHLWNKSLQRASLHNDSKDALCKQLGITLPTMTDSGGFQVFSLAFGQHSKAGKIFPKNEKPDVSTKRKNVKITDKGVYFKIDGHWKFLGPELSIKIQQKLGADIIFAFDECTSFFDGFKYNKKAMERTHKWAQTCLKIHNQQLTTNNGQILFGIVQGGRYKSLRIKSAKFIGSLPFDGIGIGGSFGKEEMPKMLKWIIPHLPEDKPRHLLGIGKVEDIFRAVESGIDLFDCVIPTREARHGRIYTKHGYIEISKFRNIEISLEKGCKCPTCKNAITREKLRTLFGGNIEEKQKAQRYATIHNVWFFNTLLEDIRKSIAKGKFREFKKKFIAEFNTQN